MIHSTKNTKMMALGLSIVQKLITHDLVQDVFRLNYCFRIGLKIEKLLDNFEFFIKFIGNTRRYITNKAFTVYFTFRYTKEN